MTCSARRSSVRRSPGYDAKVDIRYGVNFEAGLRDYIAEVDAGRRGPSLVPATTDSDFRTVAEVATTVWREAFKGIVPDDQVEYMLGKFQSYDAIRNYVLEEGYTYLMIREGSRVVGYAAYVPEGDRLFLSKIYILKEFRHQGRTSAVFDHLREVARALGLRAVYLTVNRDNSASISVYEHEGFETVESRDTPIGDGFYMHDFIMEMKV